MFAVFAAGEAEGVQDGNKDRAYFSTNNRGNVDYAEGNTELVNAMPSPAVIPISGLGSFCHQSTDKSNDMGIRDDDSIRPTDTSVYYTIWVQ